jgi:hypothetical protein
MVAVLLMVWLVIIVLHDAAGIDTFLHRCCCCCFHQAEKLNGRACMVGYFMALVVDQLTGYGLVDQQNSFLGKLLLHITVFAVLLVRSTADLDKYKNLLDEATFYGKALQHIKKCCKCCDLWLRVLELALPQSCDVHCCWAVCIQQLQCTETRPSVVISWPYQYVAHSMYCSCLRCVSSC